MDKEKKKLSDEEHKKLKKILKKYTNWYKALYSINPASADEFLKKQEAYLEVHQKNVTHDCQHVNKTETKSNFYNSNIICSIYTKR